MPWHPSAIARKENPTAGKSRARTRRQDARGWMSKLALLLFIVFILALVSPVITLVLTLLILG
jgi:hypothetical protein